MDEMAQQANGLPAGWVWTTIGEVATINRRDPALRELPDDLCVTFLPMSAVDALSGTIAAPEERRLGEVRKGFSPFSEGDVLFAKITPSMENGKATIATGLINGRGFGSTEFHVLSPADVVIADWLFYLVRQESFRADAKASFTGTAGQLRVPASFLERYRIPLPPFPEQHRIVAEIETQFTRLDAGVAALKRVQANLRRYKASVLKAACEGRLVPTEAELARVEGREFEPASALLQRILAERRVKWEQANPSKRYVEPKGPDVDELPELPEGWVWATVQQLAADEPNSITDGPFGSNLKTEHYTSDGPRVIRLQNIGEGEFRDEKAHISKQHFERLRRHEVFAEDLVIAGLGETLPRACIIPDFVGHAIVKADCIRFKPHQRLADSRYLNAALNSEVLKKVAVRIVHGIGRPRMNQQEIKSLSIPLPPLAEQHRIVAEVERRLSVVQEVEATVAVNLKRAERLRQSILKQAFEGRLVPQDANDEPASALLSRIPSAGGVVRTVL